MKRYLETTGTLDGLTSQLRDITAEGANAVMVLTCDGNGFSATELDPILRDSPIPVFGGVFPQLLFDHQRLEFGTVLLGFFEYTPTIHVIRDLSKPTTDIAAELSRMDDIQFSSMFVYVDAFSTAIDRLIAELYYEFGLDNNFVGGGAGSLSFEQKPVIITPEGLLEDAAVLARVADECGIGVKHGWERVDGPFQITRATGNTIEELDFKPAFSVYKAVIEDHCADRFTEDNFFDIAKAFPFGINKLGAERVVRDPISAEDSGALVCVGNVKEGDFVDILSGDNESLISAATDACRDAIPGARGKGTVLIDCISRVLFLEDDFQRELDGVARQSTGLIGALTLGEIANAGQEYLEFYNKTTVVAAF